MAEAIAVFGAIAAAISAFHATVELVKRLPPGTTAVVEESRLEYWLIQGEQGLQVLKELPEAELVVVNGQDILVEYLTIIRIVVERRVFVVLQGAVEDDSSALIDFGDMIRICESIDTGLVEVVQTVEAQGQSGWKRRHSKLIAQGVNQPNKVLRRRNQAQQPQVVTFNGSNIPTWSTFHRYRSTTPSATVQHFIHNLDNSSSSKLGNQSSSGSETRPTNRHPRLQKRQRKIVITEKNPDSGCLRPLLRETGKILSSTLHAIASAPVRIFETIQENLSSGYKRAKYAMKSENRHRSTYPSPAQVYTSPFVSPPAYVPVRVSSRPSTPSNSTYTRRSVSPARTSATEATTMRTAGSSGEQSGSSAGWELLWGAAPTAIGAILRGPVGAALGAMFTAAVVNSDRERDNEARLRMDEQRMLERRWRGYSW